MTIFLKSSIREVNGKARNVFDDFQHYPLPSIQRPLHSQL